MNVISAPLESAEILGELLIDALDEIIGTSSRVIAKSLPYPGNHILAQNAQQQPVVIAYDNRDGGNALLAGLAALEGMAKDRAWVHHLYPELFDSSASSLRIEDFHHVVIAPTLPPGGRYLVTLCTSMSLFTFQGLQVDGIPGLLLQPMQRDHDASEFQEASADNPVSGFRSGNHLMTTDEDAYFRSKFF